MNHLAGLELQEDAHLNLNAEERLALAAFRSAHEGDKPDGTTGAASSYSYSIEAGSLPPSGWRPLDDVTLYRFLAADRRASKFNPAASLSRLRSALAWRAEVGADQLLISPPTDAPTVPVAWIPRDSRSLDQHSTQPTSQKHI